MRGCESIFGFGVSTSKSCKSRQLRTFRGDSEGSRWVSWWPSAVGREDLWNTTC